MNRLGLALGVVLLVGAVWTQSYQGRVDLHGSQIRGCERGRLDRVDANGTDRDLAAFAHDAAAARAAEGNLTVAARYRRIELSANQRIARRTERIVDCDQAFPAPSLLPRL